MQAAYRWSAGGAGYRGCADAGFCAIGRRCVSAMAIIAGASGDCITDIGGVAGMGWQNRPPKIANGNAAGRQCRAGDSVQPWHLFSGGKPDWLYWIIACILRVFCRVGALPIQIYAKPFLDGRF